MASLDDLKSVLKETLEQRGVLGEIKSKIRAEIFTALDNDTIGKPKLSNENLIINEMIREYLEYNKYYNSLSVLTTETGQPEQPAFDREYLHKKFSMKTSKGDMPLLYEIIFGLKPELSSEFQNAAYDEEEEE